MLAMCSAAVGLVLPNIAHRTASRSIAMVYGEPREVQIIPSVLPADWANMGAECKRLEDAGVDRIQFDVGSLALAIHLSVQ